MVADFVTSRRVQSVRAWLADSGITGVPDDWLRECIQFICQSHSEQPQSVPLEERQLNLHVYAQWLESNLTELGGGSLPAELFKQQQQQQRGGSVGPGSKLVGVHAVQVNSVLDISESVYQQYRQLVSVDDNCDVDEEKHVSSTGGGGGRGDGNHLLKLSITDGNCCLHALISEFHLTNNNNNSNGSGGRISAGQYRPGFKALIRGPIGIGAGKTSPVLLLLREGCLTVLGGGVDALSESHSTQSLLISRLSALTAGAFCPKQPQQRQQQQQTRELEGLPSGGNQTDALTVLESDDDDLQLIECADRLETARKQAPTAVYGINNSVDTVSSGVAVKLSRNRSSGDKSPSKYTRPVKQCRIDSFVKASVGSATLSQSTSTGSGLTTSFAGTPEWPQTIATSSAQRKSGSAKENNRQERVGPMNRRLVELEADEDDSLLASVELDYQVDPVRTSSDRHPQNKTTHNPPLSSYDDCEDDADFSLFDVDDWNVCDKPATPVPDAARQLNTLLGARFGYLSELIGADRQCGPVAVRAFIMTQTSRLSTEQVAEQFRWKLSVRISDGSANVEATLTDSVLTRLIQMSALQVRQLKQRASCDEAVRQQLRSVLESAQRHVIELSGLMVVEGVGDADGSVVVVRLIDITADIADRLRAACLL